MESKYKNKESVVLETDLLRAEFLPDPGGKLVSLINKRSGYEYLVQRDNAVYRDQPFGGVYTKGECSGADDMFPTIDSCDCQQEPWKGLKMADHGEVWSLPWRSKADHNLLELSVTGVRFPYELSKKISFPDAGTLSIEYSLRNRSSSDFDFLWAAHLMLNMQEGTRLMVPAECRQTVKILTNGKGNYGDIQDWPWQEDREGKLYRADISRPPSAQGFEKYYFVNKLKEGYCEVRYPDGLNKLKIRFSAETVPYLGILMNENGWDGLYNIFIEPCTVCYDSPVAAAKYDQVSRVPANSTYGWHLHLTI